jgi:hypothetical protein
VAAVAFDADSRRLDVVPDSPAYGTTLRWSAQALVTAAGVHVPDANVRALHILPPAAVTIDPAADVAPDAAPEPVGPVRTREDTCDGYRQALAANQATKAEQGQLTPAVRTAIERQDQLLRERREAEEKFGDGQAALAELRTKAARQTPPDHARARALQRLAAERSGCTSLCTSAPDCWPQEDRGAEIAVCRADVQGARGSHPRRSMSTICHVKWPVGGPGRPGIRRVRERCPQGGHGICTRNRHSGSSRAAGSRGRPPSVPDRLRGAWRLLPGPTPDGSSHPSHLTPTCAALPFPWPHLPRPFAAHAAMP